MAAVDKFTAGDMVEVAFVANGERIAYRALVLGEAERRGDYRVRVVSVEPGSNVAVGAVLAPILGLGVRMTRVFDS